MKRVSHKVERDDICKKHGNYEKLHKNPREKIDCHSLSSDDILVNFLLFFRFESKLIVRNWSDLLNPVQQRLNEMLGFHQEFTELALI